MQKPGMSARFCPDSCGPSASHIFSLFQFPHLRNAGVGYIGASLMVGGYLGVPGNCAKLCTCVCLLRARQSHPRSEVTTDLLGHTHSWSPAGQHCSRNIPGVSLVLPNQFLEGLGRVTGCSHVPWWLCLDVPQGSPHICKVTREEQRGSSLHLKALEEPPSPLVSPGMGPPCPFSHFSTLQTLALPSEAQRPFSRKPEQH